MATDFFSDAFALLSEDDQCSVLSVMGQMACAGDKNQSMGMSFSKDGIKESFEQCLICEHPELVFGGTVLSEPKDRIELLQPFGSLLEMPQTQRMRRVGTVAMLALKGLLSHTREARSLDVKNSVYGQWCLRGLHNPSRDIRVAAGLVFDTKISDCLSDNNQPYPFSLPTSAS